MHYNKDRLEVAWLGAVKQTVCIKANICEDKR